jgi:uncharacterized protein YdaT
MTGKKGQQVIPSGEKWKVRRTGSSRASGVFGTQKEALKRAKELAQLEGSEIYVYGRDGRLHNRMTMSQPKA